MTHNEISAEGHDSEHVSDLFSGAFTVRIAVPSSQRVITATVTPLNIGTGEPDISAVVSWEGIEAVSSSVSFDAEQDAGATAGPWMRFLQLLWVVLGPATTPEPDGFGPGQWSSIVLSTQELDGALHHSVLVVVEQATATATFIRSDPARPSAVLAMPVTSLALDAGSVLVDMVSRLVLGRTFLSVPGEQVL